MISLLFLLFTGAQSFSVNRANGLDKTFDGIGAISGGGATSRLLFEYPEEQQNQILDYLFKPNFGASLHILKVEIGGDTQSTDGAESCHMRDNNTVDLDVGYEFWLMKQAKARNPDIKLYGLPWGFPGWVVNDPVTGARNDSAFAFPWTHVEQNVRYTLEWVKGAKTAHGLDIDFIGILNESPYSIDYIKLLRKTLDQEGFTNTQIVAADGWSDICSDMAQDPELSAAVHVIGLHYPSDYSDLTEKCTTGQPIWASEESSSYDDVNGAACWARVMHSHYVLGNMTASIMWNLLGSYYPGTSWFASSLFTAIEPWTGHYTDMASVWATAHMTQFSKIGWKYLKNGLGSGSLTRGGFYTTLVDPTSADFSMHVVKISPDHAPCTRPKLPDEGPVEPETVTFQLDPSMGNITSLTYFRSNFELETPILFEKQPEVAVVNGVFSLQVTNGDYLTVSTLSLATKGTFATPVPASDPTFPLPYLNAFETDTVKQQPLHFAQMQGGWEVMVDASNASNHVLRQMTPQQPMDHWEGEITATPFTLTGMQEWQDIAISAAFRLDQPGAAACVGSRVNWIWSVGTVVCVNGAGQWNLTRGGPKRHASGQVVKTGQVSVAPGAGSWHTLSVVTLGDTVSAYYDSETLLQDFVNDDDNTGFAALGSTDYDHVEFDNVKIGPNGPTWGPAVLPPACQAVNTSYIGHRVSARTCNRNGVVAADQEFELVGGDFSVVHKSSGLCLTLDAASAGSTLSLQPCQFNSAMQNLKYDYSNIQHMAVAMVNEKTGLVLTGQESGQVTIEVESPNDPSWSEWTYYYGTGQLRNSKTTSVTRDGHPIMCLSLCTD